MSSNELMVLLNSRNSVAIIEAAEKLASQYFDINLLSGLNDDLIPIYARLDNITDFSEIIDLIPDQHTITQPFNNSDIADIINNTEPYVNIKVSPPTAQTNTVEDILQESNKIMHTENKSEYVSVVDGFPKLHNNRRYLLAHAFQIASSQVYVSEKNYFYSKILEDLIVNLLIADGIDPFSAESPISGYIANMQKIISLDLPPTELLPDLHALTKYMLTNDYEINTITQLQSLKLIINDKYIDKNIYATFTQLKPLEHIHACTSKVKNCNHKYIRDILLPKLATEIEFEIDANYIDTAEQFLSAFPFHNGKMFKIKDTGYVTSQQLLFPRANRELSQECIAKYKLLKGMFNVNTSSYELIVNYCHSLGFTFLECSELFEIVLSFQGYICAFLTSVICRQYFGILQIDTRKMYAFILHTPIEYLTTESSLCSYDGSLSLSIDNVYDYSEVKCKNIDNLKSTIKNIAKSTTNLAGLYIMCAQYIYNPLTIYQYIKENVTRDASTTLILIRLLLNTPDMNDPERHLLYYISKSLTHNMPPSENNSYSLSHLNTAGVDEIMSPVLYFTALVQMGVDVSCYMDMFLENYSLFGKEFFEMIAQ